MSETHASVSGFPRTHLAHRLVLCLVLVLTLLPFRLGSAFGSTHERSEAASAKARSELAINPRPHHLRVASQPSLLKWALAKPPDLGVRRAPLPTYLSSASALTSIRLIDRRSFIRQFRTWRRNDPPAEAHAA